MSEHFTASTLQLALQEKAEMPVTLAALTALHITLHSSDALKSAVGLWMKNELPADFTLGDGTLAEIMEECQVKDIEALMVMDAMSQHPEEAADLLWMLPMDNANFGEEVEL